MLAAKMTQNQIAKMDEIEEQKKSKHQMKIASLKEKLDEQRRERYNKDNVELKERKKAAPLIFPYSEQKFKGINNRFDITPSQAEIRSNGSKTI